MSLTDNNQITSVDNGETTSFPTVVDQPEPPRSEPQRHVGVSNSYDRTLNMQNVFTAEFTWSTNDQSGTVLWYTELHPRRMSPPMQHLASMYTYWAGDVFYTVKIAGTAFHAGALTMVEVPPSIHPTTLAGTKDYTIYNWVMIDAKNPSLEGFRIRDVRQGAFHYIDRDAESLSTIDIGGYLMLVVDMPLNTSSTGTQQISVQIWSKPADNFQLLKLRMPSQTTKKPEVKAPLFLDHILNLPTYGYMGVKSPTFDASLTKLVVRPSTIKVSTVNLAGHYSLDGKAIEDEEFGTFAGVGLTIMDPGSYNEQQKRRGISAIIDTPVPGAMSPVLLFTLANRGASDIPGFITDHDLCSGKKVGDAMSGYFLGDAATKANQEGDKLFVFAEPGREVACLPRVKVTQMASESFLEFHGVREQKAPAAMQTREMAQLFSTGGLKDWLPQNQAALFNVIDVSENLPIFQAKLHPEGYFTTRAMKDETTYKISNVKFAFVGFVPRTSKLERSSEMSTNRMLVNMRDLRSSSSH